MNEPGQPELDPWGVPWQDPATYRDPPDRPSAYVDVDAVQRSVAALLEAAREWESPPTEVDMTRIYVLALRYIRDHLAIQDLIDENSDITDELNMWVEELGGEESTLGDALEIPEPPEQVWAWVTVDDFGLLTPDSTVTVGEATWPVPERAGFDSDDEYARINAALREHGWHVPAGPRKLDLEHSGVRGVAVDPSEPPSTSDPISDPWDEPPF